MNRQSLAIAAVAAVVAASSALAADLPIYKAPPPVMVPCCSNWTGFYIGGNIGFGWDDRNVGFGGNAFTAPFFAANEFPTAISLDTNGGFAGGQVGYNWQFNTWLVGFETDLQWSDIRGTNAAAPTPIGGFIPFTTSVSRTLDWFGTARGRVGFLVAPTVLIYGTAGLAYGDREIGFNTVARGFTLATCPVTATCAFGSTRSTDAGWTAGAGVEVAFWNSWSFKAEYLFLDLGSVGVTAFDTSTTGVTCHPTGAVLSSCSFTASSDFRDNIVRLGVNYRFGTL